MRYITRGVVGAIAVSAVFAGTAKADQLYPTNATDFQTGAQGWKSTSSSCGVLGIINVGCSVTNDYTGEAGNPSGSFRVRYSSPANLLGLFTGRGTFESPSFTITNDAAATIKGGAFTVDHRLTADGGTLNSGALAGLIPANAQSDYTVSLVDEAGGTPVVLDKQSLTSQTPGFVTTGAAVPASALVKGHTYHLLVDATQTATLVQAALVNVTTYFDNIRLTVNDGLSNMNAPASATTLPATNAGRDSATLNGIADTHGLATTYKFDYGTSASALSNSTTPVSISDVTEGPRQQPGQQVTNLSNCQTYFFRASATNTFATGNPGLGAILSFQTNCKPDAETLVATQVAATTAGLNSGINPRGEATTYHYEYGTTTAYGGRTSDRTLNASTSTSVPNNEPVAGLAPSTTYHFRIVATNALGTSTGGDQTFATPAQSAPGAPGSNGSNGNNGAAGTPGPKGASGASGVPSNVTLVNGDANALVKFRSKTARVGQKGARKGQIRIPIACSAKALRTCAGTIKIRTVSKINPSSLGKKKSKVKVTFATISYQLAAGKSGYAIGNSTPEKLRRMGQLKSIKVDLSAQVSDAGGTRQTVVSRNATYKAQKTV